MSFEMRVSWITIKMTPSHLHQTHLMIVGVEDATRQMRPTTAVAVAATRQMAAWAAADAQTAAWSFGLWHAPPGRRPGRA